MPASFIWEASCPLGSHSSRAQLDSHIKRRCRLTPGHVHGDFVCRLLSIDQALQHASCWPFTFPKGMLKGAADCQICKTYRSHKTPICSRTPEVSGHEIFCPLRLHPRLCCSSCRFCRHLSAVRQPPKGSEIEAWVRHNIDHRCGDSGLAWRT